jgi:hypothetical protein
MFVEVGLEPGDEGGDGQRLGGEEKGAEVCGCQRWAVRRREKVKEKRTNR